MTIFGESAGASLVETHLVAPRSNNLFIGAIMQSGPFDNYTVQSTPELAFTQFASLANCLNTTTATTTPHVGNVASAAKVAQLSDEDADAALRCLKQKPIISPHGGLLQAIGTTNTDGFFSPLVDGVELTVSGIVIDHGAFSLLFFCAFQFVSVCVCMCVSETQLTRTHAHVHTHTHTHTHTSRVHTGKSNQQPNKQTHNIVL